MAQKGKARSPQSSASFAALSRAVGGRRVKPLLRSTVALLCLPEACRAADRLFLESIFQDPCPTLNGTRRATMPQVLTRRREPIHPSSQARSPAPTNPKTGSGSDHPGGRSPQSLCSISPSVLSLSPTARSHCSASVLSKKRVLSCVQPLLQPTLEHPHPSGLSHSASPQLSCPGCRRTATLVS